MVSTNIRGGPIPPTGATARGLLGCQSLTTTTSAWEIVFVMVPKPIPSRYLIIWWPLEPWAFASTISMTPLMRTRWIGRSGWWQRLLAPGPGSASLTSHRRLINLNGVVISSIMGSISDGEVLMPIADKALPLGTGLSLLHDASAQAGHTALRVRVPPTERGAQSLNSFRSIIPDTLPASGSWSAPGASGIAGLLNNVASTGGDCGLLLDGGRCGTAGLVERPAVAEDVLLLHVVGGKRGRSFAGVVVGGVHRVDLVVLASGRVDGVNWGVLLSPSWRHLSIPTSRVGEGPPPPRGGIEGRNHGDPGSGP